MKKTLLTIAIVLGLSMTTFADPTYYNRGGLFQRGTTPTGLYNRDGWPGFPGHGESTDQPAPLGSGVVVLLGLGAAYLIGKKREE